MASSAHVWIELQPSAPPSEPFNPLWGPNSLSVAFLLRQLETIDSPVTKDAPKISALLHLFRGNRCTVARFCEHNASHVAFGPICDAAYKRQQLAIVEWCYSRHPFGSPLAPATSAETWEFPSPDHGESSAATAIDEVD